MPRTKTNTQSSITHKQLVEHGARWLRRGLNCGVVVVELHTWSPEIPDVIGWLTDCSIVIECKATRSDFLADAKKPHRANPVRGMGDRRFYLTQPGLIQPEELPPGWGLLVVVGRTVKVMRWSTPVTTETVKSWYHARTWEHPFTANKTEEMGVMYSLLRRKGRA